jgi:hypothetical protein
MPLSNTHGSGTMEDQQRYRLGETDELLTLSSSADNREVALQLATQAQKSLCILTRDLERAIFNTPEFAAAVARLATRSRNSIIRILLMDSTAVAKRAHRVVDLSQRLSSSIHIRRPDEEHQGVTQAFVVADDTGYLRRIIATRYEGSASFNAPGDARELMQLFDRMWEKAAPEPECRRLHL